MKNLDISRLPFTLANFAWNFATFFRKIALRLGIFLAMFRECLCVVARQLAPKCRDFSNVAKLARQCKWPLWSFNPGSILCLGKFQAWVSAMWSINQELPHVRWSINKSCSVFLIVLILIVNLYTITFRFTREFSSKQGQNNFCYDKLGLTGIRMYQRCESICEKKSEKVWNNLKCLKRCAFQCVKSLKIGFCEEHTNYNVSLKSD